MSNASILALPVEILHGIFDHIDAQTLLLSLRYVCKDFYATVRTYNRFHFDFHSTSKDNLQLISRLIGPEQVISLALSNRYYTSSSVEIFFSLFDIRLFTRLRFVTFHQIGNADLKRFLQQITTTYLISLSFESCDPDTSRFMAIIWSAVARFRLKKLHLTEFKYSSKRTPWPAECTLEHLSIGLCSYAGYNLILRQSPYLRTFSVRNFTTPNNAQRALHCSISESYSQLTSLTLSYFQLTMEDLQLILSLTPSLVHLKLRSEVLTSDSVFHGSSWEQCIRDQLPDLKDFQFYFVYEHCQDDETASLDSLIVAFQTPFWLNEKRWFVQCDYVPEIYTRSKLRLYTTPTHIAALQSNQIRCYRASVDSVSGFTKRSPDGMSEQTPTELDLRTYRIGDKGALYLADALRYNTTLTLLNLRATGISDKGTKHLADAIQNKTTLTTLDLQDNSIGDQGAQYLADALRNNTTLIRLDLHRNQIGPIGAQHLADALRNNTTLTTFDLSDNRSVHCTIVAVAIRIRNDRTLTTLKFAGNYIGDTGAQRVVEALGNNTTLITLDLTFTEVGNEGARHLADALRTNTALATLILEANPIGDAGVQHLADALRTNTTLTTLSFDGMLGRDQIGMTGAKYLAEALQQNSTLTSLDIRSSRIGDEGAQYFADTFRTNTTLTRLNLFKNEIRNDGAQHLADALQSNTTMIMLDLRWNPIGADLQHQIEKLLRRNKTQMKRN